MIVFLQGRLIPETEASVSILDRCFLYGDGLFEALRIHDGHPCFWAEHFHRLQKGAEFLRIPLPYSQEALHSAAVQLAEANQQREGVIRLTLSRGRGVRGYSPRNAGPSLAVMSIHPLAEPPPEPGWRLHTASVRLDSHSPLARFKTCNKLPQILARMEAESHDCNDALLLNEAGFVAETSSANLFWLEDRTLHTPPLSSGCLPGITRNRIIQLSETLGLSPQETLASPDRLKKADAVFATFSTLGIVPIASLDGSPVRTSPVLAELRRGIDDF